MDAAAGVADRPDHAGRAQELIADSVVAGVYEKEVDRESAYEKLKARAETLRPIPTRRRSSVAPAGTAAPAPEAGGGGMFGGLGDILFGSTGPRGGRREGMIEAAAKSASRSVGSAIAREITRGVLGSILGGKRR